ncbi:MAG TPA: hypothetical protein VHV51_05190 [Polyangiaceae bacterium]|nr:hypothetical protein [Polyangiaceae bacterium]
MAALTPKARALVEKSRGALRPTPADRDRVEAALRAQLGPLALPLDTGATLPRALGWKLVSVSALGACLVGGALFFAFKARTKPTPAEPALPSSTVVDAPAAQPSATASGAPVETALSAAPSAAAASNSAPALASAPRRQDHLAQEVLLLSRATSALNAGRAQDALKLLDEHQREFPNGVLSVERRGAKARALCALGRVSEGRAELSHLASGSPAAARASQVCQMSAPAK